jgi:hypothetical protein
MLNSPYATSRHLLDLLACLCEQFEVPANLSEMLCQTLSWAVRCETRSVGRATTVKVEEGVAVKGEAQVEENTSAQLSAHSLARCIEAVFHTLPAVVRHVHAENMVPWALDYLTAAPPRNLELRRALLSAFATNLCESPSLVPNMMRLSGEMSNLRVHAWANARRGPVSRAQPWLLRVVSSWSSDDTMQGSRRSCCAPFLQLLCALSWAGCLWQD